MAVKASIKKIILKGLYRSAVANGQTLREALDAAIDARYTDVSDGKIIASTSGSGYSVSYSVPRGLDISPVTVAEAISDLDDLYDCALTNAAAATDESRFEWMLSKLKTPSRVGYLFRGVRL